MSLFQELETETQSLVFVKRMVVIAVSSITYLRGIFPEESYRSRYLEGDVFFVIKHIMIKVYVCKYDLIRYSFCLLIDILVFF